uniref:Uncharacterized protein n=1 Tax=Meloidogyne enterolobii TaxID=390850 RepID=A0A6V7UDL0_MELEN|nr:unnamed protein product [Meloidogyne enterolobii]
MSDLPENSMPLGNLSNLAEFHPILLKHFNGLPVMNVAVEIAKELDKLANGKSEEKPSKESLNSLRVNIYRLERLCDSWLNTGHYSNVPDRLRLLYSFLCALLAKLDFLCEDYMSSLRFCDEGLLKGHDLEDESLSKFASHLCRYFLPPPPELFTQNNQKNLSMSDLPENSMPLGNLSNLAEFHPILYKYFNGLPVMNVAVEIAKELDKLANGKSEEKPSKESLNSLRVNIYRLERLCDSWLNTGHYSNVPDRLRLLYSFLCELLAKLDFLCEDYLSSLRFCDEGLLKGHDLEDESLSEFASHLCRYFLPPPPELFTQNNQKPTTSPPPPLPNSLPIQLEQLPSLEFFYKNYYLPGLPLLINGMVNGWPAFEKWR